MERGLHRGGSISAATGLGKPIWGQSEKSSVYPGFRASSPASSAAMREPAAGSRKLSVPIATIRAPAAISSAASRPVEMPPIAITGSSTAAATERICASATDLTAAPESPPVPDRKSTRLNSSHRCISYAVFCLKKKIIHRLVGGPLDQDRSRGRVLL